MNKSISIFNKLFGNNKLKSEKKTLNDEISRLEIENRELRNENNIHIKNIEQLNNSLKDYQRKFLEKERERERQLSAIYQSNQNMREEIDRLNGLVKMWKGTADYESNRNTKMQEKLVSLSNNATYVTNKNRSLTDDLNFVTKEKNAATRKLTSLQEKHNEAKANLKEANKTITKNQKQIDKLNSQVSAFDSERVLLKNEIAEKVSQLQEKDTECKILSERLAAIPQNPVDSEILAALRQDVVSKREEISEKDKQIQELSEDNSKYRSECQGIQDNYNKKVSECERLKNRLSESNTKVDETEMLLLQAQNKISELECKISELEKQISITTVQQEEFEAPNQINEVTSNPISEVSIEETNEILPPQITKVIKPKSGRRAPRRHKLPSVNPTDVLDAILQKKDFPKIENDNVHSDTQRLIEVVYDCKTNQSKSSEDIFLKMKPDEISNLRKELEQAVKINKPYLICPYCRQMVKISNRRIGIGGNQRDVQFFIHAV